MGELYDEFLKKRKKNKKKIADEWNRENPNQKISADDLAPVKTTKKTVPQTRNAERSQKTTTRRAAERSSQNRSAVSTKPKDIAPVKQKKKDTNLAPVKQTTAKRTTFDKGLLKDGHDRGDIATSIIGSVGDFAEKFGRGFLSVGESVVDNVALGVEQVAKRLDNQGLADKARNFQDRDLVGEVTGKTTSIATKILTPGMSEPARGRLNTLMNESNIDEYSFLGEKADSFVQSAGQWGAQAMLAGAGVPWQASMASSVFSSSVQSARENGATDSEAMAQGVIDTVAEIASEKLFGGAGIVGGKGVADAMKDKLAGRFASRTAKVFAKYGVDFVGEGAEEVASQFISNFGKKFTYEDDKTLKELLASDEAIEGYIESFVSGGLLSGVINAKKAAKSVKTGRDYDTGLSADEETVVNEVVKKRTGERQKEISINEEVERRIANRDKGINLTTAEKRNIRKTVMEELERGELKLDYSKTKVDKKEAAKILEEVQEDLKKGYVDMDDIEDMFAGEEFEQLKTLMSELKENPTSERKAEIEAKMDEIKVTAEGKINNLLKNSPYFTESYRQRLLKGESFTREAQDTDTKITKELAESAKAAGMNNTGRMHDLFEYTNKIANDTDTKYGFINSKQLKEMGYSMEDATINGMVRIQEDGTTKVLINVDSDKALNTIIGHETTHLFEGTQEHQELVETVKEYAVMKGEYDSRFKATEELYKNVDANIENEVTADLVGDYIFTDEQFVMELTKKPNVFQKVYDYIKHAYKMATAGSAEERQLLKAKRAFEKAYRSINPETASVSDTKYAISYTKDNKAVVVVDKDILKDVPQEKWVKTVKEQISEFKPGVEISGRLITITSKSANHFAKSGYSNEIKRHFPETYKDKMNSSQNINEVLRASTNYVNEELKHDRNDEFVDFARGDVLLRIGENDYTAKVLVGYTEFGEMKFYDLQDLEPTSFELKEKRRGPDRLDKSYTDVTTTSPKDIISQNNTKSNEVSENNEVPTFSLSAPVEETKELIAVHNMRSSELMKTLDLGGLPMPSIAIIKAKSGHAEYGDVSLVFNKETIDPKFMRANKVYGGDAWTPTYPTIEYKANKKVADKISSLYYELAREHGYDDVKPLYNYAQDLEDTLNRNKGEMGILERLADDAGMMQVYLLASGKGKVENVEKETVKELSEAEIEMNEYFINALGKDLVQNFRPPAGMTPMAFRKTWFEEHGKEVENVYENFLKEVYQFTDEEVENVLVSTKRMDYIRIILDARNYLATGPRTVRTEVDLTATKEKIRETAGKGYTQWLKDLFSGAEEKTGIRNNVDPFTRSGNRRSWEALHWENNLENVVKVMKQEENGVGFFGGSGIFGVSAKEYGSIDEIRADSGRLERMNQEDYEEIKEALGQRFQEISTSIMDTTERNQFIAIDNAMECIVDAVRNSKTKSGIMNVLKQYRHLNVTETTVDDIVDLVKDIAAMPTEYFEAKPRRAVGLDEIAAVIIPDDADAALLSRLEEGGYNVITYKAGDEADRASKLNEQHDVLFSLSNVDDIAPVSGYAVHGKDVKVDGDLAPVRNIDNDVEDIDPTMFEPWPDEAAAESAVDYEGTTVPMDAESMRLLTKNMKEVLGLNQMQRRVLKDIIQDYSTGKIATGDDLYNTISDQFSVQSYEVINEELTAVKKALRETPIRVPDSVKDGITDYYKFRQRNFGKLKLGNSGLEIDDAYEALREVYPGHFPEDITNPEDQLYHMEEVAGMESSSKEEYVLPEERIAEATDFIRESVSDYKRVKKLNASLKWKNPDGTLTRAAVHAGYMQKIKDAFAEKGMDFESVMANGKNLSTFATVDNTPQRVMEKTFGYKEGQLLSDLTVNQAAENETEAIRWLNAFTNKKNGTLAKLSKKYNIKPFSKEDAAAQKYAEGMYVNQYGDYVEYGDRQLEDEIKDPKMRANIKAFVADPQLRKIYDETLDAINASRTRNGYAPIPRRNDYFLHFREMDDTFSRIGIPFNPNDIKAKDLPTDINGMTADNKPGQPWFGSSMQRKGVGTTYSLLGGMEKYLTAAKPQIFHIDDIQVLRALRNSIADTYGQAKGLEHLDEMTDEEAEARIEQVYGSHLSTFAKFLNEEANIMAGKTALIDRGLEGVLGRRAVTFMNTLNTQVAKNMIGFNVSSSLTNLVSATQAAAKASKYDVIKAFAQTASNKLNSIRGNDDGFAEKNSAIVRRKGQDKFYRKPWEKISDTGFLFMSAIDNVSTEFIVRTKYNELTRKGMSEEKAHDEAGKWAMRILGDRSFGQMPQIFNSKTLGLVTKFQLEVRNQLDSMFYDTVQEANVSTEEIKNATTRNAVKAAKITSTVVQLAVFQHLFGKAFESVAGYNPTFDIIENLMTLFGFDDDEDDDDTFGDNLEQALLGLGEDLPYFSALTGGRIPIEAALPIEQLVQGKDDYGNDKPRLETVKEMLPYYLAPTGANQAKKTVSGLKMFDKDLPVAGSYTDSGNLRFPVAPTPKNIAQAALFGQWASENAREYFDGEHQPLKEKQIQEFKELDLPIADYWKIREGMSGLKKNQEKVDYINGLDLPISKKNILANNVVDRKEKVDLTNYDGFGTLEEVDFAVKNPGKYAVSKAVGGYQSYQKYSDELYDIKADKDSDGNSIRGSRKTKVADYINNLDTDYGSKIILYKREYPADDTYNYEIIDYLNNRDDITYDEMVQILEELKFTVDADGNVRW